MRGGVGAVESHFEAVSLWMIDETEVYGFVSNDIDNFQF